MEMMRQKLKQQQEKIQDEKLNSVQKKTYCPHFYQAASADNPRKFDVASISKRLLSDWMETMQHDFRP